MMGGHPSKYAAERQKRFRNGSVFTSLMGLFPNLRGFQAISQTDAQRLVQPA
ncbi:hypothetical protein [Hydrogenophaga atypica]|uniref:Uncharacterized protein n=1 Tax=Hydrogenophaga atypica TaxID=249409 RepID=A0ABW2QRX5_9BURK